MKEFYCTIVGISKNVHNFKKNLCCNFGAALSDSVYAYK